MPLSELLIFASFGLLAGAIITNVLLLLLMKSPLKSGAIDDERDLPKISILVAARNEEACLARCLSGLVQQDYPVEKIEILVGDDGSTDQTGSIACSFAEKYAHVKVFVIESHLGLARAKSNVLAQLARKASGDFLLFTDADMALSDTWCRGIVKAFDTETGIVAGYTVVEGKDWFGRLQSIDWAYAIGMMKVITDLGAPVTAMGNNMAIRASTYKETGGYEHMPFSVTEDVQLTRVVLSNGYEVKQLIEPQVLGITLPAASYRELLHQRKRWMQGAIRLPRWIVGILGLQVVYYPLVIAFSWYYPWLLSLAAVKIVLQSWFVSRISTMAGQPAKFASLVVFEFYSAIISLSTLIFSILPLKIKWKNRHY